MFNLNLLERVLHTDDILEINSYNKQYQELPNMFHILNYQESIDQINNIDPMTNIMIFIETDEEIVSKCIDGSLSIKHNYDINISNCKIINNNSIIVYDFYSRVKIVYPKGILPEFHIPSTSNFHNHIYEYKTVIPRYEKDNDVPNFFIIDDLRFTIYFDLEHMKRQLNTLFIKKFTDMVAVYFRPIYYVGNHTFPALDQIYCFQNSELFKTVKDIL